MTVGHVRILDTKVGEQCFIAVTLLVKFDSDLVDNLIATRLTNLRLDLFRFIWTHVVLGENALYIL